MLLFKVLVFIVLAVIALVVLINNTKKWSARLHQYMFDQANKVFGRGAGWERPWAPLLSKAMIVFFGLMFIVFLYVVVFSI
jgi:preprotein translocase subunit SecG